MAELSPKDIQEILRIFAESELEELRLEVGGTRLHVSKAGDGLGSPPFASTAAGGIAATTGPSSAGQASSSTAGPSAASPQAAAAPAQLTPGAAASPATDPSTGSGTGQSAAASVPGAPGPTTAADAQTPSRDGLAELRSPLLGVFYRRPSPDQPAFVEIGSTVGAEDPVCIVDVMKMFTRIPAGTAGRIAEILVEDGQLVEHGQVLMRIEPA
jgi:acetyl-CoA carboxylase biotin carboxyl carrier protein